MDLLDGRTHDRLVLGRVSVRGDRLDPVCARLSVESALRGADVSIPGLPPGAIVCIRRMEDPLPGRLRADRVSARPPRAWQSALSRRVEELCRAAARPWLGPVPAAAPAVLFEGRAELLACLARDLLRGTLAGAWWYEDVLGRRADRAGLLAVMRAAPEHAPGAMALLADEGHAVPFAAQLGRDEARALVAALIERFGLTGVAVANSEYSETAPEPATPERATAPLPAVPLSWAPAAPETEALRRASAPEQELFLGLALTLARAPETARRAPLTVLASALWARAAAGRPDIEHWNLAPTAPAPEPDEPEQTAAHPEAIEPRAEAARAGIARGGLEADTDEKGPSFEAGILEEGAAPQDEAAPGVETAFDARVEAALAGPPERAGGAPGAPEQGERAETKAAEPGPDTGWPGVAQAPDGGAGAVPPPRRSSGRPARTRLGGLFFLINVGLSLDLYGDFTTPRSRGIDLSIWDFLVLVGRELLGEGAWDDPVFDLLAELAGRAPDEPPGQGFEPPEEWRVPAAWLRPFPEEGPWTWAASGERLSIWHPAGFCVVDVPAAPDAAAQAARETKEYNVSAVLQGDGHAPPSAEPLRRWLGRLVLYVRARIARAMPAAAGAQPERTLLLLGATVHITEAHLDVVMSLAELPIEVRLSGLDRDPGWVPAAGRHVAFHFEA